MTERSSLWRRLRDGYQNNQGVRLTAAEVDKLLTDGRVREVVEEYVHCEDMARVLAREAQG